MSAYNNSAFGKLPRTLFQGQGGEQIIKDPLHTYNKASKNPLICEKKYNNHIKIFQLALIPQCIFFFFSFHKFLDRRLLLYYKACTLSCLMRPNTESRSRPHICHWCHYLTRICDAPNHSCRPFKIRFWFLEFLQSAQWSLNIQL